MADMKSKIQVVVDRIEEDKIAVLEMPDMSTLEIDKKYLPAKVKEGNVLNIRIKINLEKEKKIRDEISDLQQELLNRTKNKE